MSEIVSFLFQEQFSLCIMGEKHFDAINQLHSSHVMEETRSIFLTFTVSSRGLGVLKYGVSYFPLFWSSHASYVNMSAIKYCLNTYSVLLREDTVAKTIIIFNFLSPLSNCL